MHISEEGGGGPPIRECAKSAWLEKLYTTILYSTGGKVVVNTTVGQLGAVRRLSNNFRGGREASKGRLWLVKVKLLKLCRTTRSYPSELLCALVV